MKHSTWMNVAYTIAKGESKCISQKVCAIVVKDDRLKSTGHNGTPKGQPNCCDVNSHLVDADGNYDASKHNNEHHLWSNKNEIHAEANALLYCSPQDREGATLYTTLQPCSDCCKLIAASGIVRVIYGEVYHRTPIDSIDILKNANIDVININDLVDDNTQTKPTPE